MAGTSAKTSEILRTGTIEGQWMELDESDASPAEWRDVKATIVAVGGRYVASRRSWRFPYDPARALASAIAGGPAVTPDNSKRDSYFPTPEWVCNWIVEGYTAVQMLGVGARVLEPSAGDGALVRKILEHSDDVHVTAVEPYERGHLIAAGPRVEVVRSKFEDYQPAELFDAVIMNPPFSVPSQPTIWIDHVNRAWSLLKPGGRLVSIVPRGFELRQDKRHTAMRALVDEHGGWDEMPEDAFGIGVGTTVIWLDR